MTDEFNTDELEAYKESLRSRFQQPVEEPEVEPVTPSFIPTPEIEAARAAYQQTEESFKEAIKTRADYMLDNKGALALSTGTEIVGGMGLQYAAAKYWPTLKTFLQSTRAASMVGFAGPQAAEPYSTVTGVAGFLASEALLRAGPWVLSNLGGQYVSKQLGIDPNEEYSMWEAVGAGLFSLSRVEKLVDGTLKLGVPAAAWATKKKIVANIGKTAVSGATLAATEQAFVGAMEKIFNGKDKDIYEYIFAAGIGGTFKAGVSGIHGLAASRWGRSKIAEGAKLAEADKREELAEVEKQIAELTEPSSKGITSGLGWSTWSQYKQVHDGLLKQKQDLELQIKLIQDTQVGLAAHDKTETKLEEDGYPVKTIEEDIAQAELKTKEAFDAVNETTKVEAEVEAPVEEGGAKPVETSENKIEAEPVEEVKPVEEVEVEEPARTKYVDDTRESQLDILKKQFRKIRPSDEGATIEVEKLSNLATKLIDETNLKLTASQEKMVLSWGDGKDIDVADVQNSLNEVRFLQQIHDVTDQHDAYLGRGLRARDRTVTAEQHSTKQFSDAADERRAVLINLENALEAKLQGTKHNEFLVKLHEDYLGLKEQQKVRGKEIRRLKRKEYTEAEQQAVLKPEKIDEAKAQARRITRLEKQLQQEREILVGQRERPGAKKPIERTLKEKDLQDRIKFYKTGTKEAKEISVLEEKLDSFFKLLDEGDVEKIRQEVGPAPSFTKPEKVESYLNTLRGVVKKTEKDLKQKVIEADLSLQDPDQIVSNVQKELVKLNIKLNELRKRFGDLDAIKKIPKEQTELDPEIVEVKRQIEFYKRAENTALRIQAKYRQRAKLLEKQTAPLGEQRAFVEPKPEGPVIAKSKEEAKLDEDIAFLRKNLRDTVREIDQAQKDLDPVEQARRLERQYQAEEVKLNKQLDDYRAKFLAMNELEFQATGKRKKIEDDPTFKDKKLKIKYYQKVLNEIPKLIKKRQEIARLADIKGRAVMGEIRAEIEPKPKGPRVETALNKLQKEEAAIKADMRKTIREIEKANDAIIKQEIDAEIINYLVQHDKLTSNNSNVGRLKRFFDWHLRVRKSAFLFQPGSVLSGVPSATWEWTKAVTFAPLSKLFYESIRNKSLTVGKQLAKYDIMAAKKAWSDFNELKRAVAKTYKDGRSATDSKGSRMSSSNYDRTVKHLMQSAEVKLKKQQAAQRTLNETFTRILDGDLVALGHLIERSWGTAGRALGAADEFFRRPYNMQKLWSESLKEAYFEVREKGIKDVKLQEKAIEARAEQIFESKTTMDDGIRVLTEESKLREEIIRADDAFFYAADTNKIEEIHTSFVNHALEYVEKIIGINPAVTYIIKNRAPFIPMALRGLYRGTKVLAYSYTLGLAGVARATVVNPYASKIRKYEAAIKQARNLLTDKADVLDDQLKERYLKNIEENQRKIQDAKVRQHIYAQEEIATSMIGVATLAASAIAAWNGTMTGSLTWLDKEQRERLGWLKGKDPYNLGGFDYKYWEPIKHVMATVADLTVWGKIKFFEARTGEKILRDDQDWGYVFVQSAKQVQKDSPLNLGLSDTLDYFLKATPEEREKAGARALADQIPVPAIVKKATRRLSTGGKIVDLRGGDFIDKSAYYIVGYGGVNYERDAFGLEKISTSNWGSDMLRIWQKDNKAHEEIPKKVQDVFLSDNRKYKQLKSELPKTIFEDKIVMSEYTDDNGSHFENEYGRQLQKTFKINGKTLLDEFIYRIYEDDNWARKYEKEEVDFNDPTEIPKNLGLKFLSEQQNKYFDRLEKHLLKDTGLLKRFKNEEGVSIYDTVQQLKKLNKRTVEKSKEPTPLSEIMGF